MRCGIGPRLSASLDFDNVARVVPAAAKWVDTAGLHLGLNFHDISLLTVVVHERRHRRHCSNSASDDSPGDRRSSLMRRKGSRRASDNNLDDTEDAIPHD